jgi:hypothetical protein
MNITDKLQLSILGVLYDLAPQGSTNSDTSIGRTPRTRVVKEICKVLENEEQQRIDELEAVFREIRETHQFYLEHDQAILAKINELGIK